MTTIKDSNGTEHVIHYRRVPGYFNRSTYHVDIDHQHVMTVTRVSDATWSRSAVWGAYRPGVDWSASIEDAEAREHRKALFLGGNRSRELVVKSALRKLQHSAAADA